MTKLLSQEQVDQYHNSGFLSPVDVLNENEITQSLNEIESFEKETGKAIRGTINALILPKNR